MKAARILLLISCVAGFATLLTPMFSLDYRDHTYRAKVLDGVAVGGSSFEYSTAEETALVQGFEDGASTMRRLMLVALLPGFLLPLIAISAGLRRQGRWTPIAAVVIGTLSLVLAGLFWSRAHGHGAIGIPLYALAGLTAIIGGEIARWARRNAKPAALPRADQLAA